jgi:hypothetical protein
MAKVRFTETLRRRRDRGSRCALELYEELSARPAAELSDDDRRRLNALRCELLIAGNPFPAPQRKVVPRNKNAGAAGWVTGSRGGQFKCRRFPARNSL